MPIAGTNTLANAESTRSVEITTSTTETRLTTFWGRVKNVAKHPATVRLGISLGGIQLFTGLVLGLGVLALALTGTVVTGLPVFALMAAGLMLVGAVILGLSTYGAYQCDRNSQQALSQTPTVPSSGIDNLDFTENVLKIPRACLKRDNSDTESESDSVWVSWHSLKDKNEELDFNIKNPHMPFNKAEYSRHLLPDAVIIEKMPRPEIRFETPEKTDAELFFEYIHGRRLPPVPEAQATRGLLPISVGQFFHIIRDPSRQGELKQRAYMFSYTFPCFSLMKLENFYFTTLEDVNAAKRNSQVREHLKHAAEVLMSSHGFVFKKEPRGIMRIEVEPGSITSTINPLFYRTNDWQVPVANMLASLRLLGMTQLSASIYHAISNHPHFSEMGSDTRNWMEKAATGKIRNKSENTAAEAVRRVERR